MTFFVASLTPCSDAKSKPKPEVAKPPFTATPLGQPLPASVPASTNAKTTTTPNSPTGGLPGLTRSNQTQLHKGVDDPSSNPTDDITRFTGTSVGFVVRAGPAYDKKGGYLGERVTIVTANDDGVWISTTMHHTKVLVTVGQTVNPGQEIAIGAGAGDQFKSTKAGKPHVHWELTRDGVSVNPLSGEPLPSAKSSSDNSSKAEHSRDEGPRDHPVKSDHPKSERAEKPKRDRDPEPVERAPLP